MIENGLVKIGGAKMLGVSFLPGITLLALGGILTWNFWKNSSEHKVNEYKTNETKEALKNFKTELNVLADEKHELLFQVLQLKEEFLEIKKIVYDKIINNVSVSEFEMSKHDDSSLDDLILKKQELSLQISKLQEKFSNLKKTMPNAKVMPNNEESKSGSSKINMLKWIIEDNINLRKLV